ncbi:MAG: plasmid mobilization relaxosome protein MobC [Oscillospiraceae bacterium]|nr:plasmid mobilization relaxosome protein MobC [Oscillospiraceae bacterium]
MARIKTERFEIRLTPLEKEKLLNKATQARMNMAQYILALSEQKKIIVIKELPMLIKQIIKIGTNVNQIAMVANTNKSVSIKQIELINVQLTNIQELLGTIVDAVSNSEDEIEV